MQHTTPQSNERLEPFKRVPFGEKEGGKTPKKNLEISQLAPNNDEFQDNSFLLKFGPFSESNLLVSGRVQVQQACKVLPKTPLDLDDIRLV